MSKITSVTFTVATKRGEPVVFEGELADDAAVLHADLTFASSFTTAKLRLTLLEGKAKPRPHKFAAVREGHTHAGLSAAEFIKRIDAYTHTSPVEPYYLFALPVHVASGEKQVPARA